MKINFTVWSTVMVGGIKAVFEIANAMNLKGHNVTITALGGDHSWFPLKVPVIYVDIPKGLKTMNSILRMGRKQKVKCLDLEWALKKLQLGEPDLIKLLTNAIPDCDINIATWFPTAFAVYRSQKGVPFYFCQDFIELAGTQGNYYLNLFKESLFLPLNILTGSQWIRDWINNTYNKESIVTGYGIDDTVFFPYNSHKTTKPFKIMTILREEEYKGGKDLIHALNIATKNIKEVTAIIVSSKDTFKRITKEQPLKCSYKLIHRPTDAELAKLYNAANLFVFPSHVEGFGLPPLEAMACGTPVVSTDCFGVRDYIKDYANALVVPPKSPKALAEAVIKIIYDKPLQERLTINGIKTAQNFKWDKVADKMENIFIKQIL